MLPVLSTISNIAESEGILLKQFGIKECCVILHDMCSSSAEGSYNEILSDLTIILCSIHLLILCAVMNPENLEVLPFVEDDGIKSNYFE